MDLSLNIKALVSQRLIPKQDGKGRAAVVEIMLNTPLISDLIFKGEISEIKEIMKKSRNLGMQTPTTRPCLMPMRTMPSPMTRCAMPTRSMTCACRSSSTASVVAPRIFRLAPRTSPSSDLTSHREPGPA